MAKRTNWVAWGLAAVLAVGVVVVGGASLVRSLPASSRHLDNALIEATRKGNVATVKQLLIAGAPVNALVSGDTALDIAIHARRVDLVKLLLEHGADATEPIPVMKDATLTPLDLAVNQDNADIIRLLLAHGANANQTDPRIGRTILMNAAWDGKLASVQALLAGGADPNARDPGGRTALYHAAYEGHTAIVRALVAHGAVINPRNRVRWTPLLGAVGGGRPEVVKLLLALGADVNGKGYGKGHTYTALALARSLEKYARKYPSRSEVFPSSNVQNDVVIIRLLKQAGAEE